LITNLEIDDVGAVKYPPHITMIFTQYFTKIIIAYSGSKTSNEAEKTSTIIARILNDSNESETKYLKKFLIQIKTRKLKIQNIFFVHDWSLILMVI
jgi:hypothetical protein